MFLDISPGQNPGADFTMARKWISLRPKVFDQNLQYPYGSIVAGCCLEPVHKFASSSYGGLGLSRECVGEIHTLLTMEVYYNSSPDSDALKECLIVKKLTRLPTKPSRNNRILATKRRRGPIHPIKMPLSAAGESHYLSR